MLTGASYNASVIYIAATNEFNVHFVQHGSTNHSSLTSQPNITRFSNTQWRKEYLDDVVIFGDLYLSVDEYASWVNITNGTGRPTRKDDLPAEYQLPYEANTPLKDMAFNLTDWINVTHVGVDAKESRVVEKYAHVVEGFGTYVANKSRV